VGNLCGEKKDKILVGRGGGGGGRHINNEISHKN